MLQGFGCDSRVRSPVALSLKAEIPGAVFYFPEVFSGDFQGVRGGDVGQGFLDEGFSGGAGGGGSVVHQIFL